jgi:hypothetical protein
MSNVRLHMPYIVSFVKPVEVVDPAQYINDCCIGGDLVLNQVLPALKQRYGELTSTQEDWGWFSWFEQAGVKLAVEVHSNDAKAGEFQIHLTSSKPRMLFGSKIQDTAELEELRVLVERQLQCWSVEKLTVERVNEKYMPAA